MRHTVAALVLGLLLLPAPAVADDAEAFVQEHLDGLSGASALELVKELAGDGMKGRKTAFEGGALVENWMLGKMSEFGLHPADAGGTYLEPFTYGASNTVAPIALAVGGKSLTYGKDFFDLTYTGSGTVEAEAVFAGYGIVRPDLGWDDYAGLDVKGKIVVAIRGAPAALATQFQDERYIGYKSSMAAARGAAGFLLVQGAEASTGTIQDRFHRPTLPALWVSGTVADTLFAGKDTTLAALKASRDAGEPGQGFATGVTVAMEVNAAYNPHAKGHNALGAIKGRDPDLTHEVILVGAHMDHLGVGPDGQVFNGADDNASGTAVMIHLADILTANKLRPKRTIIFCGFGAEEQGLFGSRALASRYPFRGEVVAVLNMDMVGQGKPVVGVNGGAFFPKVQALLSKAIPPAQQAQVEFGPLAGGGSDHWPFLERGVPAFAISTRGDHPNYHTPLDDAAAIDPACLEAAANVVGRMLIALAMHPEPLHDPQALEAFLVREGPRYGHADSPEAVAALRAQGLDGAFVHVAPGEAGWAAWSALAAQAEGDEATHALVRTAAHASAAWHARRFGLIPVGTCAGTVEEREADIARLAAAGVRIVDPWTAAPAVEAPADVARLRAALAKHACVPCLAVADGAGLRAAREGLAQRSALVHVTVPADAEPRAALAAALDAPPPGLLVTLDGAAAATVPLALGSEGARALVLAPDAAALQAALHAWGASRPEGWGLPGTPQRAAVRAALGGRLLAWLAALDG